MEKIYQLSYNRVQLNCNKICCQSHLAALTLIQHFQAKYRSHILSFITSKVYCNNYFQLRTISRAGGFYLLFATVCQLQLG